MHHFLRIGSARNGATAIEILVIGAAFCLGLVFAHRALVWWGPWAWPLGFVGGVGATLLATLLYVAAVDILWSGMPAHPPTCRNGKCKWEEFELRKVGEEGAGRFCRCGDQYDKHGRRWVEVLPDGTERPFMIWQPWRGWVREG